MLRMIDFVVGLRFRKALQFRDLQGRRENLGFCVSFWPDLEKGVSGFEERRW